jgi:hypothetical protein
MPLVRRNHSQAWGVSFFMLNCAKCKGGAHNPLLPLLCNQPAAASAIALSPVLSSALTMILSPDFMPLTLNDR